MNNDYLILGKIKKSILEKISMEEEGERDVYILSNTLNDLATKYPDTYLKKIEGMKEILSFPDYVSKGKKKMDFYRLIFKNKKFYLLILSLERKERWILKGLKAICYPAMGENEATRMNK